MEIPRSRSIRRRALFRTHRKAHNAADSRALAPDSRDEAVELGFGTGALKVTPGHDPTDFEIGQRHGLETVNILNLDGTLNENAGRYQGQMVSEARENVVAQLDEEGCSTK